MGKKSKNSKKPYDAVFLFGAAETEHDMQMKKEAIIEISELFSTTFPDGNYKIIGDGLRSLTSDEITESLNGRINSKTFFGVYSHGNLQGNYHTVSILGNHIFTSVLLGAIKSFSVNPEEHINVNLFACFGGAAAKDIPDGMTLVAYASEERSSSIKINIDLIKGLLEFYKKFPKGDIYESTAHNSIHSAEDIVIARKYHNTPLETLTLKTPEPVLNDANLRACLGGNIMLINRFRGGEGAIEVPITEEDLNIYKQRLLVLAIMAKKDDLLDSYFSSHGAFAIDDNLFGTRPIHFATMSENEYAVRRLFENGANLNIQDENGATAVNLAAMRDRKNILRYLIQVGANVSIPNVETATALHLACYQNFTESALLLIDNGADVNAKIEGGHTPLIIAVGISNNPTLVKALLKKGADPETKDNSGKKAADYNGKSNSKEITKLLERDWDVLKPGSILAPKLPNPAVANTNLAAGLFAMMAPFYYTGMSLLGGMNQERLAGQAANEQDNNTTLYVAAAATAAAVVVVGGYWANQYLKQQQSQQEHNTNRRK